MGYRGWHSVYKLALKDNWTQNSEGDGYKGFFGLVKTTWGRGKSETDYKWVVEEVKVNDDNKVWLIIAKGQSSMYLMPVVRTPGICGTLDEEFYEKEIQDRKKAKDRIDKEGILDIANWTKEIDTWKGWNSGRDKRLQEAIKGKGFSITRKGALSGLENPWEKWKQKWSKERKGWKHMEDYEKWIYQAGFGSQKTLYKNAGALSLTSPTTNAKKCNEIEHYFPLDLVILGDSSTISRKESEYGSLSQTITITDQISEVIGVRQSY